MARAQANNKDTFGNHRVLAQTKSTLADSWDDDEHLEVLGGLSVVGPGFGDATFKWRYGPTFKLRATGRTTEDVKDLIGKYVRIQIVRDEGRRTLWYGVFASETFNVSAPSDATREQVIQAREIAHIMDRESLSNATGRVQVDPAEWADPEVEEYKIATMGRFPNFNTDGPHGLVGNRSVDFASVTDGSRPDIYVFGGDALWSFRDMVEYLCAFHAPEGWSVTVTGDTDILDQTKVVTYVESISLWGAIAHSIQHRRGTVFHLRPRGEMMGIFDLHVSSTVPTAIAATGGQDVGKTMEQLVFQARVEGSFGYTGKRTIIQPTAPTDRIGSIPAATDRITLDLDESPEAPGASIHVSSATHYNEILVIGDRLTTCFTLSVADGTLIPNWKPDVEAAYAAGEGVGTNTDFNKEHRASDMVRPVYQDFIVPDDERWKWRAGALFESTSYSLDYTTGEEWEALQVLTPGVTLTSQPGAGEVVYVMVGTTEGTDTETAQFEFYETGGEGGVGEDFTGVEIGGDLEETAQNLKDAIEGYQFEGGTVTVGLTEEPPGSQGPFIAPVVDDQGVVSSSPSPIIRQGKEFLRRLPILNPLSVFEKENGYMEPVAFATLNGRRIQLDSHPLFNSQISMVDGAMAVRVGATPSHKLALNLFNPAAWSGATAYVVGDRALSSGVVYECIQAHTNQEPPAAEYWTELHNEPGASDFTPTAANAIDYRDLVVTVAMPTDDRLQYRLRSSATPAFELPNVLTVRVDGAGIDYVVPNTARGTFDGELVPHPGGIMRNNTAVLRAVAAQVMARYGTQQASITAYWKTVDKRYRLGAMLEEISSTWERSTIRTVITSQRWNFEAGTYEFSTGFPQPPGQGGKVDFPMMSDVRAVSREIQRIARQVDKQRTLTLNLPSRFGGSGSSGGDGSGGGGNLGVAYPFGHWSKVSGGVFSPFDGT